MGLSNGKIAGLLGAVLLIALLAFAAGFLLGLDTANSAREATSAETPANAAAAAAEDDGGADASDSNDGAAPAAAPDKGDGAAAAEGGGGSSAAGDGGEDGSGAAETGDGGDEADGPPQVYTVLAGEHAVESRAAAAARRLSDRGFAAEVVALDAPNGPWFRVVVGGFADLERAREAALQIRTEIGIDALVGPSPAEVGPPPAEAANAEGDG